MIPWKQNHQSTYHWKRGVAKIGKHSLTDPAPKILFKPKQNMFRRALNNFCSFVTKYIYRPQKR